MKLIINNIEKQWLVLILLFVFHLSIFPQEGWQIQQSSKHLNSVVYSDENTAWAVGEGGIIRKSTDGGVTWQYIQGFPFVGGFKKIFFVSSGTGWILNSRGQNLKTTDGGDTWVEHFAFIEGTNDKLTGGLDMYFISSSTGWICGSSGEIYKTTNGGASWFEQQSNITTVMNSIYFVSEIKGWAVGDFGQVLFTENGGENWKTQNSGIIEDLNSVYFTSQKEGVAVGDLGNIITTTDGGNKWSNSAELTNIDFYNVRFVSPSIGFASGTSPGFSRLGSIYQTIDGGLSWQIIEMENEDFESIKSVSFSSNLIGLAVGSYNTIKLTTNGGKTWKTLSHWWPNGLNALHFISSQIGWVVGRQGKILRTSDGGESYTELSSGTTNNLNSVNFASETTGYIVGDNNTILKTTDGGDNWVSPSTPQSWNDFNWNSISFRSTDQAVIVGDNGKIILTTNSGDSWGERSSGTNINLNAVKYIGSQTFLAVGDSGIILKSTNSGASWELQESGTNKDFYSIDNIGASKIFVGGDDVMKKSTNLGESWSNIRGFSGSIISSIDFPTSTNGFIANGYGGYEYTTDGGTNWNKTTPLLSSFYASAINFVSPNIGWIISRSGDIIRTIVGGVEPISPEEHTIYEIQRNRNGDEGKSIYENRYVKTSGVVTTVFNNFNAREGYFLQDGKYDWNGIFISDSNSNITPGMDITIFGNVNESSGYTSIRDVDNFLINKLNTEIPEPIILSTVDCNKESYEGALVRVRGVCDNDSLNSREWSINDGSGSLKIRKDVLDFKPVRGNLYIVTGPVYKDINNGSSKNAILPTDSSDIVEIPSGINNDPVISNLPDTLGIERNSHLIIDMWDYVSDFETPDSLLTYEFLSSTDSIFTGFNSNNGLLAIAALSRFTGSGSVIVSVTDARYAVAQDTIFLIVDKITGLSDLENIIPEEYKLYQNYPNPFNPTTKIRYGLPFSSEVNITIYNLLGQEVKLLTNNIQDAGFHEINFNASSLSSGVYIYRISATSLNSSDKFQSIKKMLLLK